MYDLEELCMMGSCNDEMAWVFRSIAVVWMLVQAPELIPIFESRILEGVSV